MTEKSTISKLATAGLCAKGAVYVLMGILTAMAAFRFLGKSSESADQSGVFQFLSQQTGGKIILAILAVGLACYVIWRMIQAFSDSEHKGSDKKGLAIRARYFLSGVAYALLTYQVVKMLTAGSSGSGDRSKEFASELMTKDYGQLLVGLVGLIFLAIGIYQIYYGLSEKYCKHIDATAKNRNVLVTAGKIGYVSRGIVWLLIAWLFFKAAFNANSNAAGGTSKAFSLLEGMDYGSYLLFAMGLGLASYGVLNFIRARYEEI